MARYTLNHLISMDNQALQRTAKEVFSMQLDPFSALGKRAMKRQLAEVHCHALKSHLSPSVMAIIGEAGSIIECILNYQEHYKVTHNEPA